MMIEGRVLEEAGLFRHFLSMEACGRTAADFRGRLSMLGVISHKGGASVVEISDLGNPLVVPPSVNCWKSWVRRESSWHYESHSSRFCWVLAEEWTERFERLRRAGIPSVVMASDGAGWLVGAMRLVLSRHWTGHEFKIDDWPSAWEDYSHGDDGVREYMKGKCRQTV